MPEPERDVVDVAPVADTPEARLVAALAAAQVDYPTIVKNKTATVQGKPGKSGYSYSYADLGDVLAAIRPILGAHGLAVVQTTNRAGVLTTELRHVGGGILTSEVDLGQSSSNPQQYGGALTYLRRYELVTLLGIAAEEDRDAQDVEPPQRQAAPQTREVAPAWAADASRPRKERVVEVLAALFGGDEAIAKQYAGALTAEAGAFPAVVAWWLGTLPEWQAAAAERAARPPEEVAAEDARAMQDKAAEAPDTPPAGGELAPGTYGQPQEIDLTGVSPRADEVDEPTPEELAELRRAAAAPELPPAGSVDNPFDEATELDEEAIGQLRALGCVCPDPSVDVGRVDECPIRGHGIPF